MCFIGHGVFGLITKAVWCNYFGVFGIGHDTAYQLMPVVGSIDILLGLTLLVYPTLAVFAWLVFWGLFTALLRPLSGEPVAEFFERAGNYGAPSSFVRWCLRLAAFLLLAGHGWLCLIGKPSLVATFGSGAFYVGVFESAAAAMAFCWPSP